VNVELIRKAISAAHGVLEGVLVGAVPSRDMIQSRIDALDRALLALVVGDHDDVLLRVAKLDPAPNDVLIFKTDFVLSKGQTQALRDLIAAMLPTERKFMLLTYGVQISKGRDIPFDWLPTQQEETQPDD
jgi:hypothetical protein